MDVTNDWLVFSVTLTWCIECMTRGLCSVVQPLLANDVHTRACLPSQILTRLPRLGVCEVHPRHWALVLCRRRGYLQAIQQTGSSEFL